MSSIWTIRRSAEDAKLTGLCGGIARHWGVDPVLVRVGCALLALSGGIGLVLYVAGWLLIPVDGKDKAPIDDLLGPQARRLPREIWIVILVVACAVTLAVFGSIIPFGFGPAVILAAIWYFGYYRNRLNSSNSASPTQPTDAQQLGDEPVQEPQFLSYPGPPTPFTEAAQAWQQRIQEIHRTGGAAPPPAPQSYEQTPTQQPRSDSPNEPMGPAATLPPTDPTSDLAFLATPDPVGLYTEPEPETAVAEKPPKRWQTKSAKRLRLVSLIVLGLTLSGLGVADALGMSIPVVAYLSAALLVLGLTLVAGAWLGRPRFTLLAGFVLLISVVASTLGGPIADQRGWGEHRVAYSSVADFPTTDHRELGTLTVDLRDLKLTEDVTYTAGVELGRLEVRVPDDANVRLQYLVESGRYEVAGVPEKNGVDLQGVITSPGYDPKKPTLNLNLVVEAGQLEVRR